MEIDKSMMRLLYGKKARTSRDEVTSNSEEIKPVALSIVKRHQLISQSV